MQVSGRNHVFALAALAALSFAAFADLLCSTQSLVPAARNSDLLVQFVHWRKFGFDELRQGNLALWNPHLFSGVPFFGGFQPALLYPPNFLFLVLPLAKAVGWSIALHVFLSGAFMYAWGRSRQLHPLAAFLSGVMYMFCGANFFHVYAGHLPHLCAMAWMPCLFLSIDRLVERPAVGWTLIGGGIVAMIVLAGQPQYLFYAAVGAGIYSLLQLTKAPQRAKTLLALGAVVIGGAALSAIQLLTGIAEAADKSRGAGLPYGFAGMFSFPPENFLTLLAPDFFGDMKGFDYWGRWRLWEMSIFLSLTGLILAMYGAAAADGRRRCFSVTMSLLLLLLALGAYTPLFKLLYEYAPGFDQFRGNSKFIFLASLFLALLAGVGLDHLLGNRHAATPLAPIALGAAISCGAAALWLHHSASAPGADTLWHKALAALEATRESYHPAKDLTDPAFASQAGRHAADSLLWASGTLVLLGLLFWLARFSRKILVGVALLGALELFLFARGARDRCDLSQADSPGMRKFLASQAGDFRVLNRALPNIAMSLPAQDVWGMDFPTLRYGQAMAFTQGADPDSTVLEYLAITKNSPLLQLVRCRFVFDWKEGEMKMRELSGGLPHLLLVNRCRVLTNRTEILSRLFSPAFNPREEVILESAPRPAPQAPSSAGDVRLVGSGTDHLDIEADVPSASVLLITDAYAKGWRARPLSGLSQQDYQVMPANYCLRAIPLAAGRHRLRVEYLPAAFVIGRWTSLITLALYLGIAASLRFRSVPYAPKRASTPQ